VAAGRALPEHVRALEVRERAVEIGAARACAASDISFSNAAASDGCMRARERKGAARLASGPRVTQFRYGTAYQLKPKPTMSGAALPSAKRTVHSMICFASDVRPGSVTTGTDSIFVPLPPSFMLAASAVMSIS